MFPEKILIVSVAALGTALGVFFSLVTRQAAEKRKPGFSYYLLIGGLALGSLMALEINDLFLIRKHIPLETEHFVPFLSFSFRYGTLAVLGLAAAGWGADWLAYGLASVIRRTGRGGSRQSPRFERAIFFVPVGIASVSLLALAVVYLWLQWWLESPLPFCLYLPVFLSAMIWLICKGKEEVAKKGGLLYLIVWFACVGYFISSQFMQRFHDTELRFVVILVILIGLFHLFGRLVPKRVLSPGLGRKILIGVWTATFLGTSSVPLKNTVILDTFLRSNYLYLLVFLFQPSQKAYALVKQKPLRPGARVVPSEGAQLPDILLITSESLQGGLFQGSHSRTMPRISGLARGGTFFSNHHSVTATTIPSFYMMLTGRYYEKVSSREDGISFLEVAEKAGYRTVVLQPFKKINQFPGMLDHVDELHELPMTQSMLVSFHSSSVQTTDKSIVLLKKILQDPSPYLFWVHYSDPHSAYNDPEDPLGSRLALTTTRAWQKYLKEVRWVDENVGRLIDFVKTSLEKQPKIIFTADHGEEFLEHYNRKHGTYLYEESLRVPFLILDPEVKGGRVIDTATAHTDIFPTMLDWMKVRIENYPLEGQSLIPAMRGEKLSPRDTLFLIENSRGFAGLLENHKKFIYYVFHLRFPAMELFDLTRDPQEKKNLVSFEPREAAYFRKKVTRWMGIGE